MAKQHDLFNPRTAGRKLAEAGAEVAALNADRVSGGEWTTRAWDFFVSFGQNTRGNQFMAEDVRHEAERSKKVPSPPDRRAWGAIILRAAKARLIVRTGYASNKDPSCHGSPKAVWVWVG